MSAYVALATRTVEFHQDRVFDPDAVRSLRPSLQPMALPWLHVHTGARQRGLRLLTADRVAAEGIDPRRVLLVAYDWTPEAAALLERGARPAALLSFEPPVIAWSLYVQLPRLSARFPHVFLFEGARARVAPSARFHPLRFPLGCPPPQLPRVPWGERRFLAMVNSNKALAHPLSLGRWFDRPREVSLKRALATLAYPPIGDDRYRERLRAIAAFAQASDFDLYGEGWQHRHPAIGPRLHALAQRAYRGPIQDKLGVLSGYRFALVIENTRFPGYISEKLFDCLFAGCVPIYDGAPDVARVVPSEAFVDRRQFADYVDLERYLRGMSERDARRYLDAGRAFLCTAAFERFCAQSFAHELVDVITQVGQQSGNAGRVAALG